MVFTDVAIHAGYRLRSPSESPDSVIATSPMAPQLQGCNWVSSWPRLQQMPPWPPRRSVLRLATPRRPCAGAVRAVASAGPALGLDPGAGAVGTDLLAVEEEAEDVDERERLRRTRISLANKGNTPWNKGRKHSPGIYLFSL